MKRLLLIALIICGIGFSCFAQDLQSITIKITPLGTGDKPLPTTFICTTTSPLYQNKFFNKIAITDEPTLKATMAFINSHPSAIKGEAKKAYPFGSFQVALYDNVAYMGGYVLSSRQESIKYLQSLIDVLSKNRLDELLIYQLSSLLTRIK